MPRAAFGQPARGGEAETAQPARDQICALGVGPESAGNFRRPLRVELEHDLSDVLRALHEPKSGDRIARGERSCSGSA